MTRIVDFIFLIFAAFLGKKALLLSVFAFAPSVLANDIPLATLSVDNIQVRAEWNVVGDDAHYFRVEGGILMLRPNVSGVGYPDGNTITAIVEVRDKFSTLNPSYEDLTVRVTLTAVIMGCRAEWRRDFTKSRHRKDSHPPNQIAVQSGGIDVGDVIARRYTENEYNHIHLYTVSATLGVQRSNNPKTYITTSPTGLYENLKWDYGGTPTGHTSLGVNEESECFAEEVEIFQEQDQIYQEQQQMQQQILQEKTEYFNVHAPLISGFYAGLGRSVTVASAFTFDGNQVFYVNVSLGNILNELYPPKVIIDDDKAFSIDGKYPIGNSYAYFANLAVGSDSVNNYSPHGVIVLNHDCPPIYQANTWREGFNMRISASDNGKVRKYMFINGTTYTNVSTTYAGFTDFKGVESYKLYASDFSPLGAGDYPVKFSDHFLCGTE